MKKILTITTEDFIDPNQMQQPFYCWEFRNGTKMAELEPYIDVLILNGVYVLNRFGKVNCQAELTDLIDTSNVPNKLFK